MDAIEKSRPNELSNIKRVVAVMSGKGGVGKSTVTALAAVEASRRDLNTGILDADITGPSIPSLFGVKRGDVGDTGMGLVPAKTKNGIQIMSINLLLEHETDPVIWRGPLIGNAIKQFFTDVIWKDIDLLLVDLPPGTGDAPLSVMQSLPLDGVIVVSSPQDMAVLVVEKAIKMAGMMQIPILGLVENMSGIVCPHCHQSFNIFGASQGAEVAEKHGIKWLGALPVDPQLAGMDGHIEDYHSPAAETLARLAAVVCSK